MNLTATYSPDDNKLRLYSTSELDSETWELLSAAGFKYAPRQELYVAPAWTPAREDLLIRLCGEIDDEDTSLVARAEERAARFSAHGERRAEEAESTRAAVDQIASAIPLGQPILAGHHSEAGARRNADRIRGGMQRAASLWETASYWQHRAAAALRHAKYKQTPAVRARRIKRLEAELRRNQRSLESAEKLLTAWEVESLTPAAALRLADADRGSYEFPLDRYPRTPPASQYEGPMGLWSALDGGVITVEQAKELSTTAARPVVEIGRRWLDHLDNRLAYERAMLAESGGTEADRKHPEKGGACRCWASPRGANGWSLIQKVNRVSVTVLDNWGNGGENFTRTIPFDKLTALMSAAEVAEARAAGRVVDASDGTGFYLASAPVDAPEPDPGV